MRHNSVIMQGEEHINLHKIKLGVLEYLKNQVQSARGNLVTFRPSKIASDILPYYNKNNIRAKTVLVRAFLDELVERGFLTVIKKSARGKVYGLLRSNEFWRMLETNSVEEILERLEQGYSADELLRNRLSQ